MTSFIFRLLAWFATIGLGVYFILSPGSSSSFSQKILSAKQEQRDLQLQLEADKNSSEKEEFDLSRSAQEFNAKIEEVTAESEKLNNEIEGLAVQTDELDSEISDKGKELGTLEEALGKARLPLEEIELQGKPLIEKESAEKATVKTLEAELLAQKQTADSISDQLSTLELKRRNAEENFNLEKERLSVDAKKPHYLHFADKKEVLVRNKVPSGKGIFIDAGYTAGFRDGMFFLGERMKDQTALPFRCQIGLVQDNYSYLKFVYPDNSDDSPPNLDLDEKILLIRSGTPSLSVEATDLNSTQ